MAKTAASKKAKGKAAEWLVANAYVEAGLYPMARPMPFSGSLKELPGDILVDGFNRYCEEVKNQETTSIWAWLGQAETQAAEIGKVPALHFKRNRSKMYTVIPFEEFVDMRQELKKLRGE